MVPESPVPRSILIAIVVVFFLLHQDFWFWRTATPLVFGFLPIGLFYHIVYTLAAALLMALLARHAWPTELEAEAQRRADQESAR